MRVIIFFSVLIFFLIPRYIDFPFSCVRVNPRVCLVWREECFSGKQKLNCIILQIFCNHYFEKSISDMKEIFYPLWKLICALLW